MPRVIPIHSYRGGTGKSDFTANLASLIALRGYQVGVVDTDILSPGIYNILGLEPENTTKTLNNYLWGESLLEAAAYNVSGQIQLI
jgi:MinD-like ATPase involved in chromosome partitioning or flagellar assembly